MTDEKDNATETLAYRAAIDAFMNAYLDALRNLDLRGLAHTTHEHRTVVALPREPDVNLIVTATITISDVMPSNRASDVIAAQQGKPGQVHRA
jgi:hypothetical protein